jgi:transposase
VETEERTDGRRRQMHFIAFDSHKHYTLAQVETPEGELRGEERIEHEKGRVKGFLSRWDKGSPVAVETVGNYYWIVDEIENAGFQAKLVHARKAKLMMGCTNKTDKLDAKGMNRLQRTGTLPTVWIPPAELRDKRELPRTRMVLVRQRTRLKNRVHSALAKYGLVVEGASDIFGKKGREHLSRAMEELPAQTKFTTEILLVQIDSLDAAILEIEKQTVKEFEPTPETEILQTIPGVGPILSVVIGTEMGDVERFPSAGHFASYAGTTPSVHSSGGKTRFGTLRRDVNLYLKWAFTEAGNGVARQAGARRDSHVSRMYLRIKARRGHPKAIGAVARHLAEAAFWMLKKKEPYRSPKDEPISSKGR